MNRYLDLVRTVLQDGSWQCNRRAVRTIRIPGAMMRFDVSYGTFPAIDDQTLAFKSVVGGLIAFLRASRSAADFRALGRKVWDPNANENAEYLGNP